MVGMRNCYQITISLLLKLTWWPFSGEPHKHQSQGSPGVWQTLSEWAESLERLTVSHMGWVCVVSNLLIKNFRRCFLSPQPSFSWDEQEFNSVYGFDHPVKICWHGSAGSNTWIKEMWRGTHTMWSCKL